MNNSVRIGLTYAGTVIGAGFASGQELLQFFASYGWFGLLGVCVATILFTVFGKILLDVSFKHGFQQYEQLFHWLFGPVLGRIVVAASFFFLWTLLAIMLAGIGVIGHSYLHMPAWVGMAIFSFLLFLFCLKGLASIFYLNQLLTPLLGGSILFIGFYSLYYHGFSTRLLTSAPFGMLQPLPDWFSAGLFYAAYNLLLSATVLVPLGAQTPNKQNRLWGSVIGGAFLGASALFVTVILLLHEPHIFSVDLPMLYISAAQHPLSRYLYVLLLIGAMFTTALASLYSLSQQILSLWRQPPGTVALYLLVSSLIGSQLGFAGLIATFFPLFGLLSLILLLKLCWRYCLNK